MARKRTPEQNKQYYLNRVAKAKNEGFQGYGQKRYRMQKTKKLIESGGKTWEDLEKKFPGITVWDELPPDRERAYDRLEASGRFTQQELYELRAAGDSFWRIARPMLERMSA